MHPAHDRLSVPTDLGVRHGEEGTGAVQEGGGGAKGHQRVHIGGAVIEALKAIDEKLLIDHHHHGGEEQLRKPHGDVVSLKEGRQGSPPHHMPHGEVHQDHKEEKGPRKPPFQNRCLPVPQSLLLG